MKYFYINSQGYILVLMDTFSPKVMLLCTASADAKTVIDLLEVNVMVAPRLLNSQKPNKFYDWIKSRFDTDRKMEIFARVNNMRTGWISIGNELSYTSEVWTRKQIQQITAVKNIEIVKR